MPVIGAALPGSGVAASGMCVHELLAMAMPGRRLERVVGVATMAALQLVSWFYPEDLALPLVLAMAVPGFAVLARPLPIETPPCGQSWRPPASRCCRS